LLFEVIFKRLPLSRYYSLISSIAISDLRLRYKNSFLGFVWTFLQPLLFLGVLYVVFSAFIGNRIQYFPLYLLLGLIMWNMFSRGTQTSMMRLISMRGLLSQVYFPREILPITANITSFIMMLFDFSAFVIFLIIFHFVPPSTVVYLPFLLVLLFIETLGVSFALSVGNIYFRDLEHLWGIALQAGFFLVPIFLTLEVYPPYLRNLLYYNPMAQMIDIGHKVVLYNTLPSLQDFTYLILVSFAVLGVGYGIFKKFESKAIEIL
jgi:lipopolysaccharide transport system permease protein